MHPVAALPFDVVGLADSIEEVKANGSALGASVQVDYNHVPLLTSGHAHLLTF